MCLRYQSTNMGVGEWDIGNRRENWKVITIRKVVQI